MTNSDLETTLDRISDELLLGIPSALRESIRYSLLGGGKRIRPRLISAVGAALSLPPEVCSRLGCALEMVHAYTLVHDDLPAIDNDDVRRGRPTNHKVFGEATAILAGDALALLAFDALLPLEQSLDSARTLKLIRILLEAAGARGVIAGQSFELELPGLEPKEHSLETLFEVFRLKTGALFRAALTLPLVASRGTGESMAESTLTERMARLGETLGIAFQIADDLEDDFSEEKGNPAHIAAFLTQAEARLKGEEMLAGALSAVESLDVGLAAAIAPFVNELIGKISSVPATGNRIPS